MDEITDTGIKGFLKWFATVQPDLYKKVAPTVAQSVPGAFSDYHAGGWKTAGMSNSQAVSKIGYLGDTVSTDYNPSVSMAFDPSSVSAPTVDVSTAADSGGTSTSITDTIGSIVKGISTLYLTKQQANIQQQVVNTQLQRAALGLPPLPTSLSNLGVPQVSVGLSSGLGGGLAIGAAVLFGVFMLSMSKKRA